MEFEKGLSNWQTEVLQLVFDYMNGKEGHYYIYGSNEAGVLGFDFFMEVQGKIYTRNDIDGSVMFNDASNDYEELFDKGTNMILDLKSMFEKNGNEAPTEVRMKYDSIGGDIAIKYGYARMYSDDENILVTDVFDNWVLVEKERLNNGI
ncbi:hypothetical protein EQG49_04325 [Periweissella cryptocerci]|uniref:DUF600 family protein n=1 Tax=Periweissella cryptocerci TaxID=2506420 RepID=A0A4P6YSU5_9LACO|nr:hypothetical protein [Periweissella cryptocerci]QBO35741.1 hypothetical protein EQG49_04325 [Periweissella cryptocerci]